MIPRINQLVSAMGHPWKVKEKNLKTGICLLSRRYAPSIKSPAYRKAFPFSHIRRISH